jgi:hypothetical protein
MAEPIPAPPAKVLEFGAKAHLEETREAVDAFRKKTGQLPKHLTEATRGEDVGIGYKALGADDYELSTETGGKTITLKGSDDLSTFYGPNK